MTVPAARWLLPLALAAALVTAPPAAASGLLGHPPGRPALPPPTYCPVRLGAAPVASPPVPAGAPVFPCDFPDPMVFHDAGSAVFYAYATTTAWNHAQQRVPVLRSADLQHWTWIGSALARSPRWATGDVWAPDVVHARGRYELFYSARRRRDGNHCVAVATAATPAGPFRDRGPILCRDARSAGDIDAAPLVTSATTAYLYFSIDGPRHSISVVRLTRDLLRPASGRKELLRATEPWQRSPASETVEAPFPLERDGRTYLFYSAGCWCVDYRMGYATAARPAGPFRDSGHNPVLAGSAGLLAPGAGSLFADAAGATELAFHAWTGTPAYHDGGARTLRIAPVTWNGDAPQVGLAASP